MAVHGKILLCILHVQTCLESEGKRMRHKKKCDNKLTIVSIIRNALWVILIVPNSIWFCIIAFWHFDHFNNLYTLLIQIDLLCCYFFF